MFKTSILQNLQIFLKKYKASTSTPSGHIKITSYRTMLNFFIKEKEKSKILCIKQFIFLVPYPSGLGQF
jgi:hypothetical protein